MKKFIAMVLVASSLVLSGCATIIKGTDQTVSFNSSPEGAKVYIDGVVMGVTPVAITLKKNKHKTVEMRLDGYKSQTLDLKKSFDSVAILNVFWDFSTTDIISGAIVEYSPGQYHAELEKKD